MGFPATRALDSAGSVLAGPGDRAAARIPQDPMWSGPGADWGPADEPLAEPCRSRCAAFPACRKNLADATLPRAACRLRNGSAPDGRWAGGQIGRAADRG